MPPTHEFLRVKISFLCHVGRDRDVFAICSWCILVQSDNFAYFILIPPTPQSSGGPNLASTGDNINEILQDAIYSLTN